MAYPPAYARTYSFTDWETLHPADPKPGDKLDAEYDAVANALTATQTNLALIQRADGALANDSVGEDQLQDGIFDGIVDGITDDAEAARDAAAASATAAAASAASASSNAALALTSRNESAGFAAQAGVSQGIAQSAGSDAAAMADDAADSAAAAANSANEAQGFRNEAGLHEELAFDWAEKLEGPVMPAPPGWPEAVDDGMFSSKWWAIRARQYNETTTIDLGTAGTDIGNAFDIWDAIPGNELPLGQVYATWGSPTHTYVLIDHDNPSDPASWQDITGGPGPPGPPNVLDIGTVTTGAPGSAALADITGTSPSQILNLTIPRGDTGATGAAGPAGPPNALAVGTVTTGAPGSSVVVDITGTAPTQTINFTIPRGDTGAQGIQGIQGPVGPTGPAVNLADPTGLIGLVAVNGVATTAPRSDSRHAIDQAIAPTWTGPHTFTNLAGVVVANTAPLLLLNETDGGANQTLWRMVAAGGSLFLDTRTDANGAGRQWLQVDRSGVAITALTFGNATDNPTHTFYGRVNTNVADGAVSADIQAASGKLRFYGFSGGSAFIQAHNLASSATIPLRIDSSILTLTGQVQATNGTAAVPAYSFTSDPDTGVWGNGANLIALAAGGAAALAADTTAVYISANHTLYIQDGTAAAPGIRFDADGDTGVLRDATDRIAFSAGGAIRFWMATNWVQSAVPILAPSGTVALPGFGFDVDQDTGIYRAGADDMRFVSGGGARFIVTNGGNYSRVTVGLTTGSAAVPGLSFENDPDTGIYSSGAGQLDFTCDGTQVARFYQGGLQMLYTPAKIYAQPGTVAAPGITFQTDPDTGLTSTTGNRLNFIAGATDLASVDGTRFGFAVPCRGINGSGSSPSYSFLGDTDSGLFLYSADIPAITAAGSVSCYFMATGVYAGVFGSAAAPALSFINDSDTGMYRGGTADFLQFACGGVNKFYMTPSYCQSDVLMYAPNFQTFSSRAIKRETGAPKRARDILSKLRPILYRLLDGDDKEQLGLIAEEVHEVCPLLSDGKSVSYDRLALLLLADWQESRAAA